MGKRRREKTRGEKRERERERRFRATFGMIMVDLSSLREELNSELSNWHLRSFNVKILTPRERVNLWPRWTSLKFGHFRVGKCVTMSFCFFVMES